MRVNANAVLRSWTLLAAFGGSYAPDNRNVEYVVLFFSLYSLLLPLPDSHDNSMQWELEPAHVYELLHIKFYKISLAIAI